MYDAATRAAVLSELRSGASLRSVSIRTGINRSTLRDWLRQPEAANRRGQSCPVCDPARALPTTSYLYLLGMYLGDGCLSMGARAYALRVSCADSWPGVMAECADAISTVSGRPVHRVAQAGCTNLQAWWCHWPCLFPQHGPGRKHTRRIALTDWQAELVGTDPRPLIRGLLHSDGCRFTNTVRRPLPSGTRTYAYPRYMFTNESADIIRILTDALDLLGIAWRQNRRNSISVARREAVAALDAFVGPKS